MELRDVLHLLRRGWPAIVVLTLLGVVAGAIYVAASPKTFTATASVVLVANEPLTIDNAQQGGQLAQSTAPTVASVIDSPAVLSAVSSRLNSPISTQNLVNMVSAATRTGTSVIDITVVGSDARQTARIANLTASSAVPVVEKLVGNSKFAAKSPLRLEQIVSASVPGAPTSPDTKGVLVIGLIIGLALGIVVAVLRQALDTRVYNADDLRLLDDAPVLATIQQRRRDPASPGADASENSFGWGVEGFRTLRTNLGYLENADRHSFVVAAAGDGRDGAATATSLAVSMAQAGRRVLLVDCDLRRDEVGELLGVEHSIGLADVLGGFTKLEAVTHQTEHKLLSAVLAGTPQRNPSDLLSSPSMGKVLRQAESDYDDVVLHAPSLQGVSDAAIVARAAGWTIVTVAAGRSTVRQLDEAIGALARVHVTPVGFVLVSKRADSFLGLRAVRLPARDVRAPNRVPAGPSSD